MESEFYYVVPILPGRTKDSMSDTTCTHRNRAIHRAATGTPKETAERPTNNRGACHWRPRRNPRDATALGRPFGAATALEREASIATPDGPVRKGEKKTPAKPGSADTGESEDEAVKLPPFQGGTNGNRWVNTEASTIRPTQEAELERLKSSDSLVPTWATRQTARARRRVKNDRVLYGKVMAAINSDKIFERYSLEAVSFFTKQHANRETMHANRETV